MSTILNNTSANSIGPIGVFDSGYGGLTVLKELVNKLPQYDYLYLGDNARAPYGSRSFETRMSLPSIMRPSAWLVTVPG